MRRLELSGRSAKGAPSRREPGLRRMTARWCRRSLIVGVGRWWNRRIGRWYSHGTCPSATTPAARKRVPAHGPVRESGRAPWSQGAIWCQGAMLDASRDDALPIELPGGRGAQISATHPRSLQGRRSRDPRFPALTRAARPRAGPKPCRAGPLRPRVPRVEWRGLHPWRTQFPVPSAGHAGSGRDAPQSRSRERPHRAQPRERADQGRPVRHLAQAGRNRQRTGRGRPIIGRRRRLRSASSQSVR